MIDHIEDKCIAADTTKAASIVFVEAPSPAEVIRIDAQGFHYRGQFIEDAGEAHRLLVEFLRKHQPGSDWRPDSMTRRPKPPSLKELALDGLRSIEANIPQSLRAFECSCDTIRRALESLPD
jgi:hypothetical protein